MKKGTLSVEIEVDVVGSGPGAQMSLDMRCTPTPELPTPQDLKDIVKRSEDGDMDATKNSMLAIILSRMMEALGREWNQYKVELISASEGVEQECISTSATLH